MLDSFVCNIRVRQGENLLPLLFACYVNDIEQKLLEKQCNYIDFGDDLAHSYLKLLVLMYADNTITMSDSEQGMKQALIPLDSYCNDWKFKVDSSKTKK